MELVALVPCYSVKYSITQGRGGGGGGETKSGTEKRCSHNLQSGHSAWWSADNYILLQEIFLDFLEARSEPAEEIRNA